MILEANQRGGGKALALHLLNMLENDHVEVHEVSGFMSDDLIEAFTEAYAISKGTRCKQFLFSVSLNPPQVESVPIEVFENAIERIEQKLGLSGQPRSIVFHEKEGRRHAHCVWSRIDIQRMRAINMSHYKDKLQDISRELYLENDWETPEGFKRKQNRDPLNVSRAEWQQGKHSNQDPKALKKCFLVCWQRSDSRAAFAAALREYGLILAKGNRRGHVAVDKDGKVYSISRWVGVKAKEARARLGLPDDLPTVDEAVTLIQETLSDSPINNHNKTVESHLAKLEALKHRKDTLKKRHQYERRVLRKHQEQRCVLENQQRIDELPTGLRGILAQVTGQTERLTKDHKAQFIQGKERDHAERQTLIDQQMLERRELQFEIEQARYHHQISHQAYIRELGQQFKLDPTQPLIIPAEDTRDLSLQIQQSPEKILAVITDKEEWFNKTDIQRALTKHISDTDQLNLAIDRVLNSNELVRDPDLADCYTTRLMQRINREIEDDANALIQTTGYGTPLSTQQVVIEKHNKRLQANVGASLSDEQVSAIHYVLGTEQLSIAVGIAGAGKSTLLAAANDAWKRQSRRVMGGALSGKAADGLQASSKIESRTLASWLHSWEKGYHEPQTGDVFVLDEAGMVGSEQLLEFINAAKRYKMKLVLVGDPEQLQPINAGTPLKALTKQHDHAILKTVIRQRIDWQRQATLDFAELRMDRALEAYQKNGAVTSKPNLDQAITSLVEDYLQHWELTQNDESRIALAHRRKDVHKINQYVRMARQAGGELTDEVRINTDHGERDFAQGDRIVFTKNDQSTGIRNGLIGTIKQIDSNKVTVTLDDRPAPDNTIQIDHRHYKAFDHGYATTIHKSQGITVDQAFLLKSKSMDKHLTYVAMTRHRYDAKLYQSNQHTISIRNEFQHEPKRRIRRIH